MIDFNRPLETCGLAMLTSLGSLLGPPKCEITGTREGGHCVFGEGGWFTGKWRLRAGERRYKSQDSMGRGRYYLQKFRNGTRLCGISGNCLPKLWVSTEGLGNDFARGGW